MTLLIGLILLSSCGTSIRVNNDSVLVPELTVEVEKPVLEAIPEIDYSSFTEEQKQNIVSVLSVYNSNMAKLVIYAEDLNRSYDLKLRYMSNVIQILNEEKER